MSVRRVEVLVEEGSLGEAWPLWIEIEMPDTATDDEVARAAEQEALRKLSDVVFVSAVWTLRVEPIDPGTGEGDS